MRIRFQGKLLTAALTGLVLTTAAPSAALAVVLPPATADIWTAVVGDFNDPGSVPIPSSATAQGPRGSVVGSVTANGVDGPEVSVIAGPGTEGNAHLTYYFDVVGPQGELAPIDLTGTLQTTGTTGDLAVAEITGAANAAACSGDFEQCFIYSAVYPTVQLNMVLHVPTNTVESLTITAFAEGSLTGGFTADVDPLLTVDPSAGGGDPNQFSILVSPGVYNGPVGPAGVPEPATWALMITGFGIVGAALRRQRSGGRSFA